MALETKLNNRANLGEGIFTVKDISFILKIHSHEVRRVLNEYWDNRFSDVYNGRYSWGEGGTKSVNFLSLIEFKTFFELKKLGLSTQKITKSHEILSRYFNTPYPFAKSSIRTDGVGIMFEDKDALISADKHLQSKIRQVIEPFCEKIDYGSDLMAERIYPMGRNIDIVVDPHHQFGQPTIKNSNILAESIYKMYIANESPEFIAELYELEIKEVNDAITFFREAA